MQIPGTNLRGEGFYYRGDIFLGVRPNHCRHFASSSICPADNHLQLCTSQHPSKHKPFVTQRQDGFGLGEGFAVVGQKGRMLNVFGA